MVYCPQCGESLDEVWEYCPSCGHQLPLKCPHCQADLVPGSRFCSKCRNPVSISEPIKKTPQSVLQETKREDMWILLVLGMIFIVSGLFIGVCFFLGIIMIVLYVIIEFARKPVGKR